MSDVIKMKPIVSSNIDCIGYDEQNKYLYVIFNGKVREVYRYDDMKPNVYQKFLETESKGSFFNKVIKNNLKFEKINI